MSEDRIDVDAILAEIPEDDDPGENMWGPSEVFEK